MHESKKITTKLVACRFTVGIDETVRSKTLHKGDLSLVVEEALALCDLDTVDLILLKPGRSLIKDDDRRLVAATTILLSWPAVVKLIKTSKKRGVSRNVVVNSAVDWWLKNAGHSMTRK